MDTNNTSTGKRTALVDARTAMRILREEMGRLDVETMIVGIYWKTGYRAVHLDPKAAREFLTVLNGGAR